MWQIALIAAIPTLILLMLLFFSIKDYLYKKQEHTYVTQEGRFRKYLIPKSFWDDVNNLELSIYEMGYDEFDRVEFLIDQFCDKYSQIADHRVYQHRVAAMLTRYQLRKKHILSNKSFHHQKP